MPRIHFIDADERLTEGSDITALCGQVISKASWAYMEDIESVVRPTEMSVFRNGCKECLAVPMAKRMRYAIVHGELSIHPEEL